MPADPTEPERGAARRPETRPETRVAWDQTALEEELEGRRCSSLAEGCPVSDVVKPNTLFYEPNTRMFPWSITGSRPE